MLSTLVGLEPATTGQRTVCITAVRFYGVDPLDMVESQILCYMKEREKGRPTGEQASTVYFRAKSTERKRIYKIHHI